MSGSQIGTVVGGVVGGVIGSFVPGIGTYAGAQLGMAVGGMVGGAIDPTKIYGPHIGDGQSQTATDGSPISWVMGTMWVAGCIVDLGKRTEVEVDDDGKGSGTEQVSYEAHQSFSILVCESDELKGSTINSVLAVQQDGKIVYDVRPGSKIISDSYKWAANVRFLFGDEAQLPPTTFDGIHGADNEPAYRGVLLAIFSSFNLTKVGDRIPSFQFLVTSNATAPYSHDGTAQYPSVLTIPISKNKGDYEIVFATGADPDKIQVYDGDILLADSGYVGEQAQQDQLDTNLASHGDPPEPITQYSYTGPNQPPHFPSIDEQWSDLAWRDHLPFTKTTDATSITVKVWSPGTASAWRVALNGLDTGARDLAEIVGEICARGGVDSTQIDTSDLSGTLIGGYSIAKQMNAVNALGPLIGSYFAYASEYDGKINFHFYGADAVMTIGEDDILEANDANGDNITKNLRNNATEFPRRMIGQYYDPAQNYMPVTVMDVRRAAGITATGDANIEIPVAMDADTAQQAVNKAMKCAYAQLEGTLEFSVPFAGKENIYLKLVPGDPVIFRGKRWIVTNPITSNGYIKLTLQYDRQSAYTSDVQAIPGLEPTPPLSRYSGPTTLVAMNLPALRPQDTYGIYLAAKGTNDQDSWRGCNVLVSYDGQVTWQNAVTITRKSKLGTLTADIPTGGEPLTVDIGDVDALESITDDQIAAQMNAFALGDSSNFEVGQFKTATQESGGDWELTGVLHDLHGTTRTSSASGQTFTMLDNVYFLPVSPTFAGKTLYLRAVGFGEQVADSEIISIVFDALPPPDYTLYNRIDVDGDYRVDVDGNQRVSY